MTYQPPENVDQTMSFRLLGEIIFDIIEVPKNIYIMNP